MNKINIEIRHKNKYFKLSKKILILNIKKILEILDLNNCELNVYIVSDNFIQKLNVEYRNKNKPTDVLSFSINEKNPETGKILLGELLLAIDTIINQAQEYNITPSEEFFRMITHGILHLIGMTHENANKKRKMTLKTNEILRCLNF
ncbi:MAG TPA: rRNA maturation RNase YbeY [bacterium]|nr:rRNA maturation RNase YbeY [bacterium]